MQSRKLRSSSITKLFGDLGIALTATVKNELKQQGVEIGEHLKIVSASFILKLKNDLKLNFVASAKLDAAIKMVQETGDFDPFLKPTEIENKDETCCDKQDKPPPTTIRYTLQTRNSTTKFSPPLKLKKPLNFFTNYSF